MILDEILATKRTEIASLAGRLFAPAPGARRPFGANLRADRLAVIAEIKRASPSRGVFAAELDPGAAAAEYEAAGAAALSVLTDRPWFEGSLDDLVAARGATELPVLRKDFILDPAQVAESRAAGADACLLIVAALDPGIVRELHVAVAEAGMEALTEVYDEAQAEQALAAGATVVGVNNRDLRSFDVSLDVAERVARVLPANVVRVALSGIHTADGARRMRDAGYDAVLVGEALVRAPDRAALLGSLLV